MKSFGLVIILAFLSSSVFAAEDAVFNAIRNALDKVQSINKSEVCTTCVLEDKPNSCFNFLDKMYKDDFSKTTVMFNGGAKQCQDATEVPGTSKRFSSAQDLQATLQKKYPELGASNHNQIKNCTSNVNEPDSVTRYKVSKFYYFMKKFNEGATRAVEEIASINNLLGDMEPIKCIGQGSIQQAYSRCTELNKSCKASAPGALAEVAKESEQDEIEYKALGKDIETIDKKCLVDAEDYDRFAKDMTKDSTPITQCQGAAGINDTHLCKKLTFEGKEQIASCKKTKEAFEAARASLEDKNPWFRSENYFKLRKSKSVADSIKEVSLLNRKELNKKMDEFQNAALCFNGFMNDNKCDMKDIRKLLVATPELALLTNNKDQKDIAASTYLNVQTCVEIKNEFNADTVKVLKGAALDVALVLATGGVTIGYKAAMIAKNAAAAKKAVAAMTAVNAMFASQSYMEVAKSCIATAQKIELATQSGKECPGPRSNVAQAEKEHANCMMAVAMAAIDTAILGFPLISVGPEFLAARKISKASAALKALPRTGIHATLSHMKKDIPLIKNPETFEHEVNMRKISWKSLHPSDPENFPMPENKTAFDEMKIMLRAEKKVTKPESQKHFTELLKRIHEIEKEGYPNKKSIELAFDVISEFNKKYGRIDIHASVEFKNSLEQNQEILILSTSNISRESMAEMNFFNISPVGITRTSVTVEGITYSPLDFFLHDFEHARFKHSKELISISTQKKIEILAQIDALPEREQKLASWSLYHYLHEGEITHGTFRTDISVRQMIKDEERSLQHSFVGDIAGENIKPMTIDESEWLLKWARKNVFDLPEAQTQRIEPKKIPFQAGSEK